MIQTSSFGEVLDFRNLRSLDETLRDEVLKSCRWFVITTVCRIAPEAQVVLAFSIGISQTQHRLGHLIEQFLRFDEVLPRCVLSNVSVQLSIVASNLFNIVFKLHNAQQGVVVGRSIAFRNPKPLFVDINFGHAAYSHRAFSAPRKSA